MGNTRINGKFKSHTLPKRGIELHGESTTKYGKIKNNLKYDATIPKYVYRIPIKRHGTTGPRRAGTGVGRRGGGRKKGIEPRARGGIGQ